jgi:streptomycin 6-kinase
MGLADLDVPDTVRRKAAVHGAGDWLSGLPDLVADLAREWSLTVGPTYADATEAYVAAVTLEDGTPAVLKVCVPRGDDAAAHELMVLRLAAGRGCARLLRDDVRRGAMLVERLGRSLHELGWPLARRLEVLSDLAAQVWRPAPGCGLPTGADKGRWLLDFIGATWEELDRPCPARTVEHAIACATRRIAAHDDGRAVLVHGDVHEWNALESPDGFRLVDPDGLLAEAEYDLGVLMREDPVELMSGDPHDRARWLARRIGRDATAIWEWGVVERVSSGLLLRRLRLEPIGTQMLQAADRVAADFSDPP